MHSNVKYISGDIDRNPESAYIVYKAIMGSFHEGDGRFWDTTGTQCACNSLHTLCLAKVKKFLC